MDYSVPLVRSQPKRDIVGATVRLYVDDSEMRDRTCIRDERLAGGWRDGVKYLFTFKGDTYVKRHV